MSKEQLQRVAQITDSACGPAVLQMLLDFNEVNTTQENIISAAGVQTTIEKNGVRLDQLASALELIAPDYVFLYKEDATINDIDSLINVYKTIVAVNWQGFFYDSLEEEASSGSLSHGHYSLVTAIDVEKDTVTIVDPYREFVTKDRIFPLGWFKSRWWDVAEEKDRETNKDISYYTSRLLFVVLPQTTQIPESMELHRVPQNYLQQKFENAKVSFMHHPRFDKPNILKSLIQRFMKLLQKS